MVLRHSTTGTLNNGGLGRSPLGYSLGIGAQAYFHRNLRLRGRAPRELAPRPSAAGGSRETTEPERPMSTDDQGFELATFAT
jgi:hypothetical protein